MAGGINIKHKNKTDKSINYDLAIAINTEIKRLVDAGCKYIQVDEPLFARKPQEAIDYGISNLEKCFQDIRGNISERSCNTGFSKTKTPRPRTITEFNDSPESLPKRDKRASNFWLGTRVKRLLLSKKRKPKPRTC